MTMRSSFACALLLLLSSASGFGIVAPSLRTSTRLYFFGNLGDAFKNDDSLGKPKDAGLSKGPDFNESVTVNGKAVKGAVVGQKLTVVAGRAVRKAVRR